jgi:hypothetical protein
MCVECVEHGTADVDASVVVVLAACVRRGNGEYFITRVGDLGAIRAIIELDISSWEYRDGGGGYVPMEGSCVN